MSHKIMSIQQLADFIRQANDDEIYSFVMNFDADDNAWESASCRWGIMKTNSLYRKVAHVGRWIGKWEGWPQNMIDLENEAEELSDELARFIKTYVHDDKSTPDEEIKVSLILERKSLSSSNTANRFNPERQIAIIWSIEDVQTIREDLSDEQAMKVLLEVKRTHDADAGVHWDTLRFWADELYPQNERTQEVRND